MQLGGGVGGGGQMAHGGSYNKLITSHQHDRVYVFHMSQAFSWTHASTAAPEEKTKIHTNSVPFGSGD